MNLAAIKLHQKQWVSDGYSFGLRGPEIADEALITGIVDTFLTMICSRAYRFNLKMR